jgi:protein kinase C substrate 80K-H
VIQNLKVDDGICDEECCDGSDERVIKCPNKCPEFALEVKRRIKEKRDKMMIGVNKRLDYISFGNEAQEKRKSDLVSNQKELNELERKLADLKGIQLISY